MREMGTDKKRKEREYKRERKERTEDMLNFFSTKNDQEISL